MSFWVQLKRRKIVQVAAVYAVTAWLLVQVAATLEHPLKLPEWFDTAIIVLLAIGFPVTLIISWAFNLTPDGFVRDTGRTANADVRGRRIEYVLIGLLFVSIAWILYRVELRPSARTLEAAAVQSQRQVLPNSIAVLPCGNLSPDPANGFFAAGIHEQILNQLVRIHDLNVIAKTSVLQYADAARPITDIARELKVVTVMECSVSYADGRVAIAAQLIDGETGVHRWSEIYNRELIDVFGIQADIARNIAGALQAELSPAEQRAIERRSTSSGEAYALYLRAITLGGGEVAGTLGVSREEIAELHRYLDEAISIDPDFALAYAAKARDYAYSMARTRKRSDPTVDELEAMAMENAQQALALQPDLGLAHAAIANVHRFRWREAEGRAAFERAFELSPNDVFVLFDFAAFNAHTDRREEARTLGHRMLEINPAQGDLLLAIILLNGRRPDEAAEAARRAVARAPESDSALAQLGQAEVFLGNASAAQEALRRAERLGYFQESSFRLANLAYSYHRIGRDAEARRVFDRLEALSEDYEVGLGERALAHLSIGDEQRALVLLEEAAQSRATDSGWLLITRIANNAYGDPRLEQPEFAKLRARLGFRPARRDDRAGAR